MEFISNVRRSTLRTSRDRYACCKTQLLAYPPTNESPLQDTTWVPHKPLRCNTHPSLAKTCTALSPPPVHQPSRPGPTILSRDERAFHIEREDGVIVGSTGMTRTQRPQRWADKWLWYIVAMRGTQYMRFYPSSARLHTLSLCSISRMSYRRAANQSHDFRYCASYVSQQSSRCWNELLLAHGKRLASSAVSVW
jgi:hypothetical protein